MSLLDEMLKRNDEFVQNLPESYLYFGEVISKYPNKQVAIYTCMDTRLVDFLEPALGIARGQAKIIKAAGNMVTEPFGEPIRSLIIAVYELGVKEIVVVGHEDCGMVKSSSASLREKMLARGVKAEALQNIDKEFASWVDAFSDPAENVLQAVRAIKSSPFLPDDIPVHGLLFCPNTGKVKLLVKGYGD